VKQFSFLFLSQILSPQPGQTPQSGAQVRQSSPLLQKPSPQSAHFPQSWPHDEQFSPASQTPLPHVLHNPQSSGQLVQDFGRLTNHVAACLRRRRRLAVGQAPAVIGQKVAVVGIVERRAAAARGHDRRDAPGEEKGSAKLHVFQCIRRCPTG